MTTASSQPKFVRWAVVLGIVIVLNVFFLVVRSLVFAAPDFETYCPNTNAPAPGNAQACDALGGTWTDYGPVELNADPKAPAGYCDLYSKCQPAWQAAEDTYQMQGFALLVALGVIALIAGTLVPVGSSIVSTGLAYGGVLTLVIASVSYWSEAGNWLRLAISVVALAALLFIGIRKFRD
jgi:hypothetical protein